MPVFRIPDDLLFPDPELADEDGLLGVGGDLSTERLLLAYRNGIFPWHDDDGAPLWWSPDPRCVLFPDKLRVSTSLRQAIRRGGYVVRFDTCFKEVIRHCSAAKRKGQRGTWISGAMQNAYLRLHQLGVAHSTEVFVKDELVGGLYGVAIGRTYSGESMFHLRPDASKIALYHLVARLREWGFPLIDCQVANPHLLSLGAEEMPRTEFLLNLRRWRDEGGRGGSWS